MSDGQVMEESIAESAEIEKELYLPVYPIKQSFKWDCGAAAFRILVRYLYGLQLTAQDAILLTGSTESGADEFNMTRALDAIGLRYSQSEKGTLNKLKKHLQEGQPSIVHLVMADGGGHYMVFSGYDTENVFLADPFTGKTVKYGIPYFLGVWKVEEGETQTRWYLVVVGRVEDKITSLIQRYKRIQKKVQRSRK